MQTDKPSGICSSRVFSCEETKVDEILFVVKGAGHPFAFIR